MLPSPGHMDTALITDGSVASGSAATTRVSVGGGGCGATQRQWRVLPSPGHVGAALLTDGSVDSRSAATACVFVGGSSSGVS